METLGGNLSLDGPIALTCVGSAEAWEPTLLARLAWLAPRPVEAGTGSSGVLTITVTPDEDLAEEEYVLAVSGSGIAVRAATVFGAGQATITLRQLIGPDAFRAAPLARAFWHLPTVRIADRPAHAWRGFLLDPARHFVPRDELLLIIDRLAMHRINRLHLHLTDDQGWRVASTAYPRLAEVASWRAQTAIGGLRFDGSTPEFDGTPHGGYYTLDDLREITAYAHLHGITVIPEIDLPAHASALLAAIPELVTQGCPTPTVAESFMPSGRVVNPLPEGRAILATLITEVAEAVDSPYFHIGGDEASLTDWSSSPQVSAYLAEHGLADVAALRADLTEYLVGVVEGLGRRPIVWEEAFAAGGISPSTIVMAWLSEARGIAAMDAGHDVIMSPVQSCYLDYSEDGPEGRLATASGLTMARVTQYAPEPHAGPGRLLGMQAALWGEFTPDPSTRSYRTFPRLCVLAANAWTGCATAWPDLRPALESHLRRLEAAGVEYRPLDGPHPWQLGGTGRRRMDSPLTLDMLAALMAAMATGPEMPDIDELMKTMRSIDKP